MDDVADVLRVAEHEEWRDVRRDGAESRVVCHVLDEYWRGQHERVWMLGSCVAVAVAGSLEKRANTAWRRAEWVDRCDDRESETRRKSETETDSVVVVLGGRGGRGGDHSAEGEWSRIKSNPRGRRCAAWRGIKSKPKKRQAQQSCRVVAEGGGGGSDGGNRQTPGGSLCCSVGYYGRRREHLGMCLFSTVT